MRPKVNGRVAATATSDEWAPRPAATSLRQHQGDHHGQQGRKQHPLRLARLTDAARRLPIISMMTGRPTRDDDAEDERQVGCTAGTLPRRAPTRMKPAPQRSRTERVEDQELRVAGNARGD